MSGVQQWLTGVLASALLTGAALSLMPEGGIKQVGRLMAGLILFLAVARPLIAIRIEDFLDALEAYQQGVEEMQDQLIGEERSLQQGIIDREVSAYIQEKTEGLPCRVEIQWEHSGALPVPSGFHIFGQLKEGEREALEEELMEAFGVKREQIRYTEEGP